MSGLANNFIKDPVVLPIGSIKHTVLVSNGATGVSDTTILYENGVWIPHNAVYSQSTYPELYSQLGLLNASVFVPRNSGVTYAINSVVYGNGIYVAGTEQTWLTSTDATTWTFNNTYASQSDIGSIIYGNSVYVIYDTGNFLRTTTNFSSWTSYTPGQGTIRNIHYYNGTYFLCTTSGIFTSADLSSWTQRRTGDIAAVLYGNGIYMANVLNYNIATSTDGITWTSQTSPGTYFSLTYGDGIYLVCGFNGMAATSTNGVSWTQLSTGTTTGLGPAYVFNSTYFVCSQGTIRVSTDNGATWAVRGYTGNVTRNMIYVNGLYILSAQNGVLNTSTNAFVNVSIVPAGITGLDMNGLLYQNGTYFLGGTRGILKTTTDVNQWPLTFNKMIYNNGLYVYSGFNGVLGTSTDAVNWITRNSGTTSTINALVYGNGIYVYAGNGGVLATSTDAVTWTAKTSGTTSTIYALVYNSGRYIYGGHAGVMRYSDDNGVTWTSVTSGSTVSIFSIAYGNSRYVHGGNSGVIRTSTDNGITWTTVTSATTSNITTLVYQNGVFSYVTLSGGLGTSTDGITWAPKVSGTTSTNIFNALIYGNGLYLSGGGSGYIGTANNTQTLNYASYNLSTQFFVPALTGQGTFGTVTFGAQPAQRTFIKAKHI